MAGACAAIFQLMSGTSRPVDLSDQLLLATNEIDLSGRAGQSGTSVHVSALLFSVAVDPRATAASVSPHALYPSTPASPRAPPAPSPSPRAGIQTHLRVPPAPVNTTLLAPALQDSSPRLRLRAQLEAEGQGTSLCTARALPPPMLHHAPPHPPLASPPLYPAPIAFHVVPSCRVSLGLSRPSILPSAPPHHPTLPTSRTTQPSPLTSRATPHSPRFRLGPISFDLGVLQILVAIRQYSRHGSLAQSSIPGTHATPCRLAPVPTSTLCRFSRFCSLAYRAPYSTSMGTITDSYRPRALAARLTFVSCRNAVDMLLPSRALFRARGSGSDMRSGFPFTIRFLRRSTAPSGRLPGRRIRRASATFPRVPGLSSSPQARPSCILDSPLLYPPPGPGSDNAPANSAPNPSSAPASALVNGANGNGQQQNGSASHPGTPNPQAANPSPKLPGVDSLWPASRGGRREREEREEERRERERILEVGARVGSVVELIQECNWMKSRELILVTIRIKGRLKLLPASLLFFPPVLREGERGRPANGYSELFFSKYGVGWTEFARLEYFDLIRYTVVDLMHNGVAKTHWYDQWIQTKTLQADTAAFKRELSWIHDFLASYESPLWAGILPLRVGEPAGGSVTADEYKFAVTDPWASIPIVWERFLPEATAKYDDEMKKYNSLKRKAKRDASEPTPRMIAGKDEIFLQFATALKLILGRSIRPFVNYKEYYGENDLKANHHWAVHVPDQLPDYGPVYNFWAFLTERLNKLLKNLNSNNWTGGFSRSP
ncbi:hypothetical protein B0H13DRAFT_2660867 [Mycena leptocephala]|nr:hypothetical protein B0H13DRAFT_2660867 [Mycena leptocephala]